MLKETLNYLIARDLIQYVIVPYKLPLSRLPHDIPMLSYLTRVNVSRACFKV